MKESQRLNSSHSVLSAHHVSIPQPVLTALEEASRSQRHTRILIALDARQHLNDVLLCLHHLLHDAQSKPVLILSSASALPELAWRWQTALSPDGHLLFERFPLYAPLTLPLGEHTRVCCSTVRALQLQQVQDTGHLAGLFELIVAYDFPATLSPVWMRVIERMAARSLIVFCAHPRPEVMQWCDTAIAWERGQKNR